MLGILAGVGSLKAVVITSGAWVVGGVKSYAFAFYLLAKPAVIYTGMRFTWLMGIASVEWWSGRLYGMNCIGEGFNGFYNHLFQIASPVCTGLLTTHIGLMGVLVASFVITCMWSIYSFIEYIRKSKPMSGVINEYNDVKNAVDSGVRMTRGRPRDNPDSRNSRGDSRYSSTGYGGYRSNSPNNY